MTDGNSPQMSLRKLATVLGVSQPFLSQIRAGTGEAPPLAGHHRRSKSCGA